MILVNSSTHVFNITIDEVDILPYLQRREVGVEGRKKSA